MLQSKMNVAAVDGACGNFSVRLLCSSSNACTRPLDPTSPPPPFSQSRVLSRCMPSVRPAHAFPLDPFSWLPCLLNPLYCFFTALQVLCGQEGRPSRRRQSPVECEMHGCSDASQAHLQSMLTEFIFGFDSDAIVRALLQLVCVEQSPWLVLPLQSMLSRLIVEHGQVAVIFATLFSAIQNLPCTFVF